MKKGRNTTNIGLSITYYRLQKIDEIACKMGLDRSKVVAMFIDEALAKRGITTQEEKSQINKILNELHN